MASVSPLTRLAAGVALVLTPVAACSADDPATEVIEAEAVTIAAQPDGGFLWADINGTVFDDDGDVVATVAAETDGQRGLLGLAVDANGRVFVSYTDVTFDLVIAEIIDGEERLVWRGPKTVQGGNGGRMLAVDDELVIGIGLLNDRDGQADPSSIVGKVIAIDPDAAADEQVPRILSGPWNNPFAFDVTPSGDLWVADNHPQDGDERLARGDLGFDPAVALVLSADSAPSGLAATNESLYICSYNDLELNRFVVGDEGVTFAETVADDCVLDVELLSDGDLVYSTGSAIVRITPP